MFLFEIILNNAKNGVLDKLSKGINIESVCMASIAAVSELLGHASVTTTQNYLSATNKDLQKTQELLKVSTYDNRAQQLDPLPAQYIVNNQKNEAIFGDYSRTNFKNILCIGGLGQYGLAY